MSSRVTASDSRDNLQAPWAQKCSQPHFWFRQLREHEAHHIKSQTEWILVVNVW
jgi:hypothetical protein